MRASSHEWAAKSIVWTLHHHVPHPTVALELLELGLSLSSQRLSRGEIYELRQLSDQVGNKYSQG